MSLTKNNWNELDMLEFEEFLNSLCVENKVEWTRKIVNTQHTVLAIPTPVLRKIAKEIMKGNYLSFLNLKIFSTHESVMVYGIILAHISNFEIVEKYLSLYAENVDNWACCDVLSFNIKNNEANFLNLSKNLVHSNHEFTRRIGVDILFKYVNDRYINDIFTIVSTLKDETEYYVNMAVAWLMCDCFIKQRDPTLSYLSTDPLNTSVTNKFISKCRDSFRVSSSDKTMLLSLKNR